MSDVVIFQRFRVKRDTAANFAAANTVLLEGEFALETDTRKLKLGDGSTAWNSLDYVDAAFIPYDNTTSDLAAGDVQAALDELAEEKLGDAPSDGNFYGRRNGAWASGGGGGSSWVELGTYDQAVDGNLSTKDFTDLGDYQEFMVIGRGITTAASADIAVRASVDNGANFFSSASDYALLSTSSVESGSSVLCSSGSSSSAKSPVFFIQGNIAGQNPYGRCDASGQSRLFVASTAGINALRIGAHSSTMTGGKFTLYGR